MGKINNWYWQKFGIKNLFKIVDVDRSKNWLLVRPWIEIYKTGILIQKEQTINAAILKHSIPVSEMEEEDRRLFFRNCFAKISNFP
jgi:hypothetical protein